MIKKITIRNFKAIKELTIEFTPLTVLIGENSSGKSTILQALNFLCSTTSRDIDEYLKDREWEYSDVKSQFSSKEEYVSFCTEICIDGVDLVWELSINSSDDDRWIIKEYIKNKETDECYLSLGCETDDTPYDFSQLNIKSSALKLINIDNISDSSIKYNAILRMLKAFMVTSSSFELLSIDKMRSRGSRSRVSDIGMGGEKLAAFIHRMLPYRKNELNKMVSEFIGYDVKITTTMKGQPGWVEVEMYITETWDNSETKISKRHISDGLLRIIAFSAILVNKGNRKSSQIALLPDNVSVKGFILLDEIEDGINPTLSEKLMKHFRGLANESKRQVIMTSHSPVMINFVDSSDIQFMWRDRSGMIHSQPLFRTEAMKEMLDFLGPGEVWLNYGKERIIESLLGRR